MGVLGDLMISVRCILVISSSALIYSLLVQPSPDHFFVALIIEERLELLD